MSIDLEFDRHHLWHPYTSLSTPLPVYPVQRADGCVLTLEDGRTLIDGTSSWWAAIHGYNHPKLNAAVTGQVAQMSHVMFGGITHQPAIELGKQLLAVLPKGLDRLFYADSGSIAVEVALKMALQYQLATGHGHKTRILSLRKAYHGDTFAAMAVCDPVDGMHQLFQGQLTPQLFAPAPRVPFDGDSCSAEFAEDIQQLEQLFAEHHLTIAAFIIEPVLQGAGGMRLYHSAYLTEFRRLCDQYQVLLIADEIATGFGRTGTAFACQHAGITPDIMCLGKALSGGYITLAATVCRSQVAEGISQGEVAALMHGPTYMANPLACAVACASVELFRQGDWQVQVRTIEAQLRTRLLPLAAEPGVRGCRVLGAVGVVELEHTIDVAKAQRLMVDKGVWIRPFGNLLYLMPPYIISEQQLATLCDVLCWIVKQDITSQAQVLPGA